MITEDYVSWETGKLMGENGFDQNYPGSCYEYRIIDGVYIAPVPRPTLQMAMKYLREVHNIFIGVNTVIGSDKNWGYEVFIQKQEVPIPSKMQWDWFNTYEQACETAIKYCLENLI